jgi:hypothetical protein
MRRIWLSVMCFAVLSISTSASARYLITWDDFSKTEVRCSQRCVASHWEEVIHCSIVCGDALRSHSFRVIPPVSASRRPAPSAQGCVQECWPEQVFVCDQYEQECGSVRVPLPDGDFIDLTIIPPNSSGLPGNLIEVVLQSGPEITWWKAINIHSSGSDTEIWNQDDTKSASVQLNADQFRNARWIEFKKAKTLGIHTGMYDLKQLDHIQPGSRVIFNWVKD